MPTENNVLWCGTLCSNLPTPPRYALSRPQHRDNAVLKNVISAVRNTIGVLWFVGVLHDKIVYYMTIKRKIR